MTPVERSINALIWAAVLGAVGTAFYLIYSAY